MTSKQHRLRRSTAWHALRGIRIGRKVAWRVLGFSSPRAYREWRDQRIRHEHCDGWRRSAHSWRRSPTSEEWLSVQSREYHETTPEATRDRARKAALRCPYEDILRAEVRCARGEAVVRLGQPRCGEESELSMTMEVPSIETDRGPDGPLPDGWVDAQSLLPKGGEFR